MVDRQVKFLDTEGFIIGHTDTDIRELAALDLTA
jgi:hypothetical protein